MWGVLAGLDKPPAQSDQAFNASRSVLSSRVSAG